MEFTYYFYYWLSFLTVSPLLFIPAMLLLIVVLAILAIRKKTRTVLIKRKMVLRSVLCLCGILIMPQFVTLPAIYRKADIDISPILKSNTHWGKEVFNKLINDNNGFEFENKKHYSDYSLFVGGKPRKEGLLEHYFYRNEDFMKQHILIEVFLYDDEENAALSFKQIANPPSYELMSFQTRTFESSNLQDINADNVYRYFLTKDKIFWSGHCMAGKRITRNSSGALIQKDNIVVAVSKACTGCLDSETSLKANESIVLLANLL